MDKPCFGASSLFFHHGGSQSSVEALVRSIDHPISIVYRFNVVLRPTVSLNRMCCECFRKQLILTMFDFEKVKQITLPWRVAKKYLPPQKSNTYLFAPGCRLPHACLQQS